MPDTILETKGLTKHYGGVHALEDADFVLKKGEHVAIMGDNGAGKSTFVRQITGVEQRTRGTVIFDGEEVNFAGPLDAREAGIETVFQTLALADDLNVPDNLSGQDRGQNPEHQEHHRQHVWRAAAMRGDCPDGDLCQQADDHGRADGGAGCAGNRAGGEHHSHIERAGREPDPSVA